MFDLKGEKERYETDVSEFFNRCLSRIHSHDRQLGRECRDGFNGCLLFETASVARLKAAAPSKEPKARARRPQRSRKKTSTKSAGNSVTEATLNVRKTLSPKLAVLRAWPS